VVDVQTDDRILIVDAEIDERSLHAAALRQAGYDARPPARKAHLSSGSSPARQATSGRA
jgi:hypothetical protein